MTQPNDPDPWPRYAIFEHALKLSRKAAEAYYVENKPTSEWTHEQILLVALMTLRDENRRTKNGP